MEIPTDGWTEGRTFGQTHGQLHGQLHGQMGKWTDKQTKRQRIEMRCAAKIEVDIHKRLEGKGTFFIFFHFWRKTSVTFVRGTNSYQFFR